MKCLTITYYIKKYYLKKRRDGILYYNTKIELTHAEVALLGPQNKLIGMVNAMPNGSDKQRSSARLFKHYGYINRSEEFTSDSSRNDTVDRASAFTKFVSNCEDDLNGGIRELIFGSVW
jgi:hypothetical protein